jgi:hypothetical protein
MALIQVLQVHRQETERVDNPPQGQGRKRRPKVCRQFYERLTKIFKLGSSDIEGIFLRKRVQACKGIGVTDLPRAETIQN